MADYVVTRGVVLRETQTKEADKILTVLSADLGRISVIARGVRRKSCRYAACAQPLVYSEWTLYHRGEWYYANEASPLELFGTVRTDLERMALGFYFAELTEAVAENETTLLPHLLNALYALGVLHKPPEVVKAAFEWKLMALAGYEPSVEGCAYCGAETPQSPMLDVMQGVLHCKGCGEGGRTLSMPLCEGSLAALRHVLYGDAKRLYSFRLGPEALERLSDAAEAFTAAQLERSFRTLNFYKGLRGTGLPAN